jgi:hypothetical protein
VLIYKRNFKKTKRDIQTIYIEKKKDMKKNVSEAYNNNWKNKYKTGTDGQSSNEPKRKLDKYIKVSAKKLVPNDGDDNSANKKEYVELTILKLEKLDAENLKNTLFNNAETYQYTEQYVKNGQKRSARQFAIKIQIPDEKFAKWTTKMVPKINTVLEASTECNYKNLGELELLMKDAVHSAPSQETSRRAEQSLKKLKEAIYKAISENRWDDAMVMYKKAINLVARVYGHQLSPGNVKSIYAQAEAAGIKPGDKGAETNSYWDDGTEKFWPTFVRSAKAWRLEFGRTVKDEPKMQYAMISGNRQTADKQTIDDRLKSQGLTSLSDISSQQREKIKSGGLRGIIYGVGYDISDTEGPDNFFETNGLLNNLEGTLTPSAVEDNEMWLKKLKDLKKNDPNFSPSDENKRRELASTDEGAATIFLDAIKKLCSMSKYEGGWSDLNVNIVDTDDKVKSYLLTIEDVSRKKLEELGWRNNANINKIAQMSTAAVALSSVGASRIESLGYDFKSVNNVFKTYKECESSVLSVADSIVSSLNRIVDASDKKNAKAITENGLSKFFNLMERMKNRYDENYNYELSEGLIHRPDNETIMNFLKKLGLNIEE